MHPYADSIEQLDPGYWSAVQTLTNLDGSTSILFVAFGQLAVGAIFEIDPQHCAGGYFLEGSEITEETFAEGILVEFNYRSGDVQVSFEKKFFGCPVCDEPFSTTDALYRLHFVRLGLMSAGASEEVATKIARQLNAEARGKTQPDFNDPCPVCRAPYYAASLSCPHFEFHDRRFVSKKDGSVFQVRNPESGSEPTQPLWEAPGGSCERTVGISEGFEKVALAPPAKLSLGMRVIRRDENDNVLSIEDHGVVWTDDPEIRISKILKFAGLMLLLCSVFLGHHVNYVIPSLVVLTNAGEEWLVDKIGGTVQTMPQYVDWGIGAGVATKSDVALFTAAPEDRVIATYSKIGSGSAAKAQFLATQTSAAGAVITNVGFWTAAALGTLVVHADHAPTVLNANDQIEYALTIDPS